MKSTALVWEKPHSARQVVYRKATFMKQNGRLSVALTALIHLAERSGGAATSEHLAQCVQTNSIVIRRTLAGLRQTGLVIPRSAARRRVVSLRRDKEHPFDLLFRCDYRCLSGTMRCQGGHVACDHIPPAGGLNSLLGNSLHRELDCL